MGGQILKFASRVNRSAWLMFALILAYVVSAYAQLPANVNVNSRRYIFAYQLGTNIAPQAQTLQVISETQKNFTVSTQLVTPCECAELGDCERDVDNYRRYWSGQFIRDGRRKSRQVWSRSLSGCSTRYHWRAGCAD